MRMPAFLLAMCLTAALLVTSCSRQQDDLEPQQAVYYWRTDFRLDSAEQAFISKYGISKIYCRYFDVVIGPQNEPQPNATITFSSPLPEGVCIVPTVYITEDCMHQSHQLLAENIVRRISQMNETHDIGPLREIQIDCDYTARSLANYFKFLKQVAEALERLPSSPALSTTIRLHQLSMEAPPADYGVLMLYNTGDPRNFQERNPVLDYRDVHPYLRRLSGFPLPLAAAYPVYQWVRHIHGVRIEHTVQAEEILRVKEAVEQQRPTLSHAIITYCLDKDNIRRYTPETYEKIYHH